MVPGRVIDGILIHIRLGRRKYRMIGRADLSMAGLTNPVTPSPVALGIVSVQDAHAGEEKSNCLSRWSL